MVNQELNNLLKDPRINWKFIWIVVILGFLAGAGILGYYYLWIKDLEMKIIGLELKLPEVKPPKEIPKDETANLEEILPEGAFIRDKLELDVDQDGKNEILALYVLSARIEEDPNPWCGNLSGEKLLGDFYLAFVDQNKLQSQVELVPEWFENGGESKNTKLINPQDLNGDGKELEFIFLRYASCNGYDRQVVGYSLHDKKLKNIPFYRDGNEEIAVFTSGSLIYEGEFLIRRFYSQLDGNHKVYYEWNSELEKFFFSKEEINCCELF